MAQVIKMNREEFILAYTRYHFEIYKDRDWENLNYPLDG